jgi:hypothetical protein
MTTDSIFLLRLHLFLVRERLLYQFVSFANLVFEVFKREFVSTGEPWMVQDVAEAQSFFGVPTGCCFKKLSKVGTRRDSFEDLPERFAVRSAKPLEIGVF